MVLLPSLKMSVLLLSILGVSSGLVPCPMSNDIKPCTCKYAWEAGKLMSITCEKMKSFDQIVDTFRGHFTPSDRVSLELKNSDIEDMQNRSLAEFNMTITNLKMNYDLLG